MYPNASLIISNPPQILDKDGIQNVVFIGTPSFQTSINDLLANCLTTTRLSAVDYSEDKVEDYLPIPRSIEPGRQMEIYAELGKQIRNRPIN